MKIIPAIILSASAVALAAVPAEAQLHRGEKSFGPRAGYVSKNQSACAGLFFQYSFSRHFRLSPELGIVFRHKDRDALTFDLNAHVPFGFENGKVALYPLAGLAFSSWGVHDMEPVDEENKDRSTPGENDVTTHVTRLGANVGGGVELRCTSALKLSLEAKYVLVKDYSGAVITMGISYVF